MGIGSHGSTFAGSPLAMSLANVVLDIMTKKGFEEHLNEVSKYFLLKLNEVQKDFPELILEVRGRGFMIGNPDLFRRHRVILTPLKETSDQSTEKVTRLWTSLGAEVVLMTPEHHDDVLAQTSHLPHLLAYALVDTLSAGGDSLEVFEYAAGGFRDFSRIAASDPTMWSDIFSTNASPVVDILEKYVTELQHLKQLIEEGDSEALKAVFERAKAARDHFSKLQQTRHANGG